MKYESIQPHHSDIPLPELSDEDIEIRVFRNMEANQKKWRAEQDEAGLIFQYPDDRTLFQRMAAWWYLRSGNVHRTRQGESNDAGVEPNWTGHWATVKYL